jgi:hypothetical protein
MKYIKTFESRKSFLDDLHSICLEFQDEGCNVSIYDENQCEFTWMPKRVSIRINFNWDIFTKEWKTNYPQWFIDCCERLKEFAEAHNYMTLFKASSSDNWIELESSDELNKLGGIKRDVKIELILKS